MTLWWGNPHHSKKPIAKTDLRVGGRFHVQFWGQDDQHHSVSGVYREVVPPERIVNTERWGPEWPETVNTTLFSERDGETTVTQIVHYPSKAARDAALATGMMSGVERSYDLLDALLRKQR